MGRLRAIFISYVLVFGTFAQTQQSTSTAGPQAASFLRRTVAAMTAGLQVNGVTLSGNVSYSGVSGTSQGSFTFVAANNGQSRFDANLPSGTLTESRTVLQGVPSGSGIGPGGTSYTVNAQNPMTASAWFFPVFALSARLPARTYGKSYVAQETKDGVAAYHLTVWQQANGASADVATAVQVSTLENMYLQSSSRILVAVAFKLHPASTSSTTDVPVEIHYSNFKISQGVSIAYHIQVFMNNAVVWDIQISSVSLT